MHMRVFVFSSLSALIAAAFACGTNSVPALPTAQPSIQGTQSTPAPFTNVNGGEDVLIGESAFLSFTVQNIGSQGMVVSSVTYTGDPAITLMPGVTPSMLPATIAYDQNLVVEMTCTPVVTTPEMKETYNGSVNIKSNASNLPDLTIYVQCIGLPILPDGGIPDGG